jgi:Zn-dependent protease with chaperone function
VRTLRWFYGHTVLDGQTFSYLATPMQILKGRLIALVALVAYYAVSIFAPLFSLVLIAAFFIALPWIVVASLRFHARMSAYRGEADAYALAWLDTACIPPRRFADLLGRIDKDASDTHLMSSHPGTHERIQPFQRPAACP